MTPSTTESLKRFPCPQCGAKLVYSPGTTAQECPYCGHAAPIAVDEEPVRELDFREYFQRATDLVETEPHRTLKCSACAAEFDQDAKITATTCPYCAADIVAEACTRRLIRPRSLLPFQISASAALAAWRNWINRLWFAPSALRRFARADQKLTGAYTPFWTYDCDTVTRYRGQRGDDYWVTEHYTAIENGRPVQRSRMVRKTRWTRVSGTARNSFDDILIPASRSLPEKHVRKLEPWDLHALVPYADEYLSGFRAEAYQIDLVDGFMLAQKEMAPVIRTTICRDIGGDHQIIDWYDVDYRNITFKHLLLPVWVSAYRYRNRVFRFLVNARTGEVQGERPWSWIKITLFVLVLLAVAAVVGFVIIQGK